MSRNTQCATMPCCCSNRPGNRCAQRSETSDTDEYDCLKQSFPRSDYSGRSSQKYENSSGLDDQTWGALTSLRQKVCRFITSEPDAEIPADSPGCYCPCPRSSRYGGSSVLRRANDLIDYAPQSEFLKKMKQQCQLLSDNQPNVFTTLEQGPVNDSYDFQVSNGSPRMYEQSYNSESPARVRFNQQRTCDDEMLYQNSSYDPRCSADEKLLDTLIDKTLPSDQSVQRPKSANKKSEHISRSKKPTKCRGRRKRKSGSPEKCESDQFEPTLKRPHENSCERCWRYASPARSPVNKPDQKFDPNFRRGHSCYDFEGGDGEFYDRHVSPCKNLQPITSRERQQQQELPATPSNVTRNVSEARQLSSAWQRTPETRARSLSPGRRRSPDVQTPTASISWQKSPEPQSQTFTPSWQRYPDPQPQTFTSTWHKSPEAQPLVSSFQRCPEPQPQMFNSTWHKSPEAQPFASSWQSSVEGQPQTSVSIWHKSPEPQPQMFNSTFHKSPEVQPQMFNSTFHKSPEIQPQMFNSTWPKSPEPQPQMFNSTWPKSPEPQPQMFNSTWHKCPEVQPRQTPQQRPQTSYRGQTPPPQNDSCYPSMRSPERLTPRPQPVDYSSQPPASQGIIYSGCPRSRPKSCIPGDFYSSDMKRCSDGMEDLDITEYKSICLGQRGEMYDPANTSLSIRPVGNTTQSSVGERVCSRQLSPPRPGPASLGTIPEAADSDSSRSKSRIQTPKPTPKVVKVKSPKSPPRQGTPKTPVKINGSPSPNKKTKSPNRSSSGSTTNKSSKSPNRSGNESIKVCKRKSPSPKPGTSKQEVTNSPKKSPQKSPPKAEPKKIKSLDNVKNTTPSTPQQRPQSSDPRVRETSYRRDQVQVSPRAESPDQYLGLDHEIRDCSCGPETSFSRDVSSGKHIVCCHCNWDKHPNSPKASRGGSPRRSVTPENKSQTYKGFDGRPFECPHRNKANVTGEPLDGTMNSSFERDCRLLSELQNTPSFQSSFQGMSPIQGSPRKYFMFYMTKCKENKGDDDVEVLVEELTQACPAKTDSRTKDLTEKMKKIMECPSDSMALRFQKGVSDQCRIPQSSRVLYF